MAQYSLHAYDADVYIPEFKGLMQYGDQVDMDLRFSPDCMNVETPGGVLQPASKAHKIDLYVRENNNFVKLVINENEAFRMMYARMRNQYATVKDATSYGYMLSDIPSWIILEIEAGAEYDAYLFIVGKNLYEARILVSPEAYLSDIYSTPTLYGIEIEKIKEFDYEDQWSWCTYEHNYPDEPVSPGDPTGRTNVIIFTSKRNGMYVYNGFGDARLIESAPEKATYVARYAERIWCCSGSYETDLYSHIDSIYYSRPFNYDDWTEAGPDEQPEDGGGMIREATFDTDEMMALVPFGDSLIVFSRMRAWRITGTDPSNFYIQEQYGNGTNFPDSIAVMGDRIIMLGIDSLVIYDGTRVTPILKEAASDYIKIYNSDYTRSNIMRYRATAINDRYVLSIAKDLTTQGQKYLIYDSHDNTVVVQDINTIVGFCNLGPIVAAASIYNRDANTYVCIHEMLFNSWESNMPADAYVKWQTPWIELGRKDIQKGGFEVYFTPEIDQSNTTKYVKLKFAVQTEKKTKVKTYTIRPMTSAEQLAGKLYKQKRLHFGGVGRRFRLIIEHEASTSTQDLNKYTKWRLTGGIHIIAETDAD